MRWKSVAQIKQLVIIKGTKKGLVLQIDDSCSFDDAFIELEMKLIDGHDQQTKENIPVTISLGYRYLKAEDERRIRQLLEGEYNFLIQKIKSDVVSKADVNKWREEHEVKSISQTVRSGQVLSVKGDLLLIGNVNPGGTLQATGNIYVMGNMHGIAHAGFNGDERAVVVATFMKPSQLRIANYISRSPDYETEDLVQKCGYIDHEEKQIVIDKLQVLPSIREELTVFERRIIDG